MFLERDIRILSGSLSESRPHYNFTTRERYSCKENNGEKREPPNRTPLHNGDKFLRKLRDMDHQDKIPPQH